MPITGNYDSVSAELKDLLFFSRVESGQIAESVFASHVDQANTNPMYFGMLKQLAANAEMHGMYSMLVGQGPEQILALVGMLVQTGAVEKSAVRDTCKISKTPARQKAWYNQVRDEMFPAAYLALQQWWTENREAVQAKHPEAAGLDTVDEFFRATGKANLGVRVAKYKHAQSGKECPLSLVMRIDHNAPSKNGTAPKKEEVAPETAPETAPENGA